MRTAAETSRHVAANPRVVFRRVDGALLITAVGVGEAFVTVPEVTALDTMACALLEAAQAPVAVDDLVAASVGADRSTDAATAARRAIEHLCRLGLLLEVP